MSSVGDTIREARGEKSLRSFASATGVSHMALHNWELGRATPGRGSLALMIARGGRVGRLGRLLMAELYPGVSIRKGNGHGRVHQDRGRSNKV